MERKKDVKLGKERAGLGRNRGITVRLRKRLINCKEANILWEDVGKYVVNYCKQKGLWLVNI
jgi:hypothetical protein